MILVTLGTQDKSFERLLKMVDKEINKGTIKDRVIAQVGVSKYQTNNMEIIDFTSKEEMQKLIKDAKYIITHGGVGTIFDCLKLNKKVIAVPRLSKYGEHHNDHQLQIIKEFSNKGYIIDGTNLSKALSKLDEFKPKKYKSNNELFINKLEEYIKNNTK